MKRLMISGGNGGLAGAVTTVFRDAGWEVERPCRQQLDIRCKKAVDTWFDAREPFDLAICNAGITRDAPLARQEQDTWDDVMATNLSGAVWCAAAAARHMGSGRGGHIIMIGSYIAEHPKAGQILYAASKSALKGVVKSSAREWGRRNIRVNLVYPGYLDTPMTCRLKDEVRQRAISQHVLGRLTSPEQAARFILFLHETMTETSGQIFSLDSRII